MTAREQSLMFETLELLRKNVKASDDFRDKDWKDVDDYELTSASEKVELVIREVEGGEV